MIDIKAPMIIWLILKFACLIFQYTSKCMCMCVSVFQTKFHRSMLAFIFFVAIKAPYIYYACHGANHLSVLYSFNETGGVYTPIKNFY